MIDMRDRVTALVRHFEMIDRKHMRGMPIANSRLSVEAVGFKEVDGHVIGILITPWFMNLVLLPGTNEFHGHEQGSEVAYALPAGPYEFTVSHDVQLGIYLTAVMFRTMADFPDQDTACDVAKTVLELLHREPDSACIAPRKFSRRELFGQPVSS